MVKGIQWLFPDVENAVHPPLRLREPEQYKYGCLGFHSANRDREQGGGGGQESSFGLESTFYKNAEQWTGPVLYWFSKAVSLVNIKMT